MIGISAAQYRQMANGIIVIITIPTAATITINHTTIIRARTSKKILELGYTVYWHVPARPSYDLRPLPFGGLEVGTKSAGAIMPTFVCTSLMDVTCAGWQGQSCHTYLLLIMNFACTSENLHEYECVVIGIIAVHRVEPQQRTPSCNSPKPWTTDEFLNCVAGILRIYYHIYVARNVVFYCLLANNAKFSCQHLLSFCGRFERSGVQASCRAPNSIYQTR